MTMKRAILKYGDVEALDAWSLEAVNVHLALMGIDGDTPEKLERLRARVLDLEERNRHLSVEGECERSRNEQIAFRLADLERQLAEAPIVYERTDRGMHMWVVLKRGTTPKGPHWGHTAKLVDVKPINHPKVRESSKSHREPASDFGLGLHLPKEQSVFWTTLEHLVYKAIDSGLNPDRVVVGLSWLAEFSEPPVMLTIASYPLQVTIVDGNELTVSQTLKRSDAHPEKS